MPLTKPQTEREITIRPDGSLQFIWDDELADLLDQGQGRVSRASHVEPNVHGQWEADLAPVGGPVLGPFRLRQQALDEEVAWLRTHL